MPQSSGFTFRYDDDGGWVPPSSDVRFENECAMWRAEFDAVGEAAVRHCVERKSYTPAGMQVARQWLVQRELFQLREEVQNIRALAEQAHETANKSLRAASETIVNVDRANTDGRDISKSTAPTKKGTRLGLLVAVPASVFALGALATVIVSSRHYSGDAKRQYARPSNVNQDVEHRLAHAMPSGRKPMVSEGPPQDPIITPADPPETRLRDLESAGQSTAQTPKAPAIPPQSQRAGQVVNPPPVISQAPVDRVQPWAEPLALIADQMDREGPINFTVQYEDVNTDREYAEELSYNASNVTIDPRSCRIGYRWRVEKDGAVLYDQTRSVELSPARNIWVSSIADAQARRNFVHTDPQVYLVHVARWDNGSGVDLYFHDKDAAARVGAAARQAMRLCESPEQPLQGR